MGIPTPSPTPRAIFSLLLSCGLSTMLTSCGFEGVGDGAAVESKSFVIEVENPVSLDVEEGVEVEVGLGLVVEGSIAVVLVTGLVLVNITVTLEVIEGSCIAVVLVSGLVLVVMVIAGEVLEEARVLVDILVEGEGFEYVIGVAKAIKSGLETTILNPVSRQLALAVSQTRPIKAEPQSVLVHIATAFKKVTLEHRQAFDTARVVIVGSGQPDAAASASKHG